MSYAGKDPRSRRSATSSAAGTPTSRRGGAGSRLIERELSITSKGVSQSRRSPSSGDEHEELDWEHIGIFVAGAVLGVLVGAGAALLVAPQSGARTRHNLARRGRHLGSRTADAWDDLRHELRYAARRGRRTLERKLSRALHDRRDDREPLDHLGVED